jgi:threonine dehydrogenase-like Zn-dependent dehydrogenase
MRAVAVRPGQKTVEIVQHPEPVLETPTQVRLRVLEVGVCGTDREICAFDYGTPPPGSDHLVIGHECLTEVVEVGSGVTAVRPGDLVVPTVRRPCPHAHCWPCRSGRPDFCRTGDIRERGIKEAHGFMTELVVEEEAYLNPVPRELRDVAALVEPLTIAEKSLLQLFDLQERLPWTCPHAEREGQGHCHKALVLGAGPVGLLGAMAFAVRGFETYVFARDAASGPKGAMARGIGATYVSAATDPLDTLRDRYGAFDVIYEATGSSRLAFESLGALGPNGVAILTGVPGLHGRSEVDTDRVMRTLVLANQIVLGTVNAGRDGFGAAIADLAEFRRRWPAVLPGLITGRFPIESFRELLLGPPSGIKNLISFEQR